MDHYCVWGISPCYLDPTQTLQLPLQTQSQCQTMHYPCECGGSPLCVGDHYCVCGIVWDHSCVCGGSPLSVWGITAMCGQITTVCGGLTPVIRIPFKPSSCPYRLSLNIRQWITPVWIKLFILRLRPLTAHHGNQSNSFFISDIR